MKVVSKKYPRSQAVRVLTRVLSEHVPLDEALKESLETAPDGMQQWLLEVCAGTLRWKGRLDSILNSVAFKKKPTGWLRRMLLIAVYQLVAQDRTPAAWVVSETVDVIREKEGDAPAKFANACLRKIADHAAEFRNLPFSENDGPEEHAAWASLPPWLWQKLFHQYGLEWTQAYALASLERPKLWISSKDANWNADWVGPGVLPTSWEAKESRGLDLREGYGEGAFFVQDISSQILLDQVSKRLTPPEKGRAFRALDLCASPGGKSVGLAWRGFQVTATDYNPARLPLLKENVARLAAGIQVVNWDEIPSELFDLVWVDAPCTGTGILRRHPDVRWLRQEKEVAALAEEQKKLLALAWNRVGPGGYLMYSVCSVLKEEGERQIDRFVKENPAALVVETWSLSSHEAPHGDGFFGGLLRKKETE